MKPNRFFGVMLLLVSILIVFGLFGTATTTPDKNSIAIPNEIGIGSGLTFEEQVNVDFTCLGLLICTLALVYLGGIVHDEYAHIQDIHGDEYDK